ncbi:zf-C2HC5-domain-containing protein [Backusella circina FSU 941]|nr:zf-C2HC5-domain-containing protein [Backusella circina FSU 941]
MSTESPDIFADRVMEMVGATDDALNFIQEFTKRRFETPKPATPTPPPPVVERKVVQTPPSSSSPAVSDSEGVFPSLPSNNQPYETMWPANISVHQKKDDEYFAGLRKTKRGGQKNKANQDLKSAAILSDKPAVKKEKKKKNEMTLEDALKELDIKAEKPGKKRKPCQCQATKHPLLTAAPNCLNCGKIICTAEGVGPCSFCGSPVLSKEQQVALIAEAKQKRREQKESQQQQQQSKRVPATKQGSIPYSSKVSGNYVPASVYDQEEENRLKAEEHKEKLLEFQRTSAQRSTVIDQATDFELPTDQANPWLSPQERALLIKKQQSNLRRIERAGQSSRRKVMTIDISSKQVKMQDVNESSSSSDEEAEPVKKMTLGSKQPIEESSAGTYAHNPLLKGLNGPTFVGKKSKESKGKLRRKERVQYDKDDIMNDYMYTSSMEDEDQFDSVAEPITCG